MVIPVTISPNLALRRVHDWCAMPFCKKSRIVRLCVEINSVPVCQDCIDRIIRGEESL